MKILFTSVGRRCELIESFRLADKLNELIIYGGDISSTAPALYFCDKRVILPRIDSDNYIDFLYNFCKEEHINMLIPTIDTDLLILSKNKELFNSIGTIILISDYSSIKLCRDKRLTYSFFTSCGLLAPIPFDNYLDYNLNYPAFIKPIDGSSSIDTYKVLDSIELENKANYLSNYIVQPFIEGIEYTIDLFCDLDSNPIFITPRKRLKTRSGEVLITEISTDKIIIDETKKIIDKFKPIGPLTIQLIRESKTNKDYFIEINPRFGGGSPLSIKAGANSPKVIIDILNNVKIDNNYIDQFKINNNSIYSRFDNSICTYSNNIEGVIFDLDDTLYPETSYIKSGFSIIEKEFNLEKNSLFKLFKQGLKPLDIVFKNNKDKEKALELYRNHIPNIKLYPGILGLINYLKEHNIFVGIITDGRVTGQNNKIKALNLNVDKIIITDSLGIEFRKPNDISFRMMSVYSNLDYSKMIYIGDNSKKDFIAPNKLGIKTLWFDNKDSLYNSESYTGNSVKSIKEMTEYLKKIIDK